VSKYTGFYKFYNSQIYEQALHLPSTLPPHSPSPIRIEAAHFPRLKVKLAARESSKKTNIKPSFLSYPLHLHSHPTPLPRQTRQTTTIVFNFINNYIINIHQIQEIQLQKSTIVCGLHQLQMIQIILQTQTNILNQTQPFLNIPPQSATLTPPFPLIDLPDKPVFLLKQCETSYAQYSLTTES